MSNILTQHTLIISPFCFVLFFGGDQESRHSSAVSSTLNILTGCNQGISRPPDESQLGNNLPPNSQLLAEFSF